MLGIRIDDFNHDNFLQAILRFELFFQIGVHARRQTDADLYHTFIQRLLQQPGNLGAREVQLIGDFLLVEVLFMIQLTDPAQ